MVLICVTAALERHPVLVDPLKVPVAIQVCCTIVVSVAWLFTTLWEKEVDVDCVVIVVYSVAVADGVQDMVPWANYRISLCKAQQTLEKINKKTGVQIPEAQKRRGRKS